MKSIPSFWVDSAARIDVDANKVGGRPRAAPGPSRLRLHGRAAGWLPGEGGAPSPTPAPLMWRAPLVFNPSWLPPVPVLASR